MRLLTFLASATPLIALTTARITGFSAPSTVAPGAPVGTHLRGRGYIQSVQNVAAAFGIAPPDSYYRGTLGTLMGERFLGPGKVFQNTSVPICVKARDERLTCVWSVNREFEYH
jgi:hypothetical protein